MSTTTKASKTIFRGVFFQEAILQRAIFVGLFFLGAVFPRVFFWTPFFRFYFERNLTETFDFSKIKKNIYKNYKNHFDRNYYLRLLGFTSWDPKGFWWSQRFKRVPGVQGLGFTFRLCPKFAASF